MLNLQVEARTISGRTLIKNIEANLFPCQDAIYGSLTKRSRGWNWAYCKELLIVSSGDLNACWVIYAFV